MFEDKLTNVELCAYRYPINNRNTNEKTSWIDSLLYLGTAPASPESCSILPFYPRANRLAVERSHASDGLWRSRPVSSDNARQCR